MAGQHGAIAMQAHAAAARVARVLRHCFCNFRRSSAAMLLLQHLSWERSKRRSNAATARVAVALLQQALRQRYGTASTRVVAMLQ